MKKQTIFFILIYFKINTLVNGQTFLHYLIKNCTGDALKNSSVEITKMTLAGVKTSIEVESIDEVKNLLFLCKQKVILYKLIVNFVCIEEYEELKSLYFEFVKINHLQVSFFFQFNYFVTRSMQQTIELILGKTSIVN